MNLGPQFFLFSSGSTNLIWFSSLTLSFFGVFHGVVFRGVYACINPWDG